MKHNNKPQRKQHFTRGATVYTCCICQKHTRDTGMGEQSVDMCARCYCLEGYANQHSDDAHPGAFETCPICTIDVAIEGHRMNKVSK